MAEQATHGFTRRSFIKGAAALTAAGALVGCSPWKKRSRLQTMFPTRSFRARVEGSA